METIKLEIEQTEYEAISAELIEEYIPDEIICLIGKYNDVSLTAPINDDIEVVFLDGYLTDMYVSIGEVKIEIHFNIYADDNRCDGVKILQLDDTITTKISELNICPSLNNLLQKSI